MEHCCTYVQFSDLYGTLIYMDVAFCSKSMSRIRTDAQSRLVYEYSQFMLCAMWDVGCVTKWLNPALYSMRCKEGFYDWLGEGDGWGCCYMIFRVRSCCICCISCVYVIFSFWRFLLVLICAYILWEWECVMVEVAAGVAPDILVRTTSALATGNASNVRIQRIEPVFWSHNLFIYPHWCI